MRFSHHTAFVALGEARARQPRRRAAGPPAGLPGPHARHAAAPASAGAPATWPSGLQSRRSRVAAARSDGGYPGERRRYPHGAGASPEMVVGMVVRRSAGGLACEGRDAGFPAASPKTVPRPRRMLGGGTWLSSSRFARSAFATRGPIFSAMARKMVGATGFEPAASWPPARGTPDRVICP